MAREKINWLVEELDVKEFVKPLKIEIPIDKGQYGYIFNKDFQISNRTPDDYFKLLEKGMINKLFKSDEYNKYKILLDYNLSLSYIPNFKDNNWYIGYSPVQIYNSIFEILNINERLDYIDYNNHTMVRSIQKKINMILEKRRKEEDDYSKLLFIEDSIKAIDNIFLLSTYDVESKIRDVAIYKNLLYYLSVKSLDLLDETEDLKYGVIPAEYYIEVSSLGKSNYPNNLYMGDEVYSYSHANYNSRMNEVFIKYPILLEKEMGINEINIMNELDIIKSDNFIEDVEEEYWNYVNHYAKKKDYTKSDRELNLMLQRKINFYKALMNIKDDKGENIVISTIKGKNSLQGYYGFVLNNSYIVLDKFFKIRQSDLKAKPAYDEAIYIMPIDLFLSLEGSKKKIKEYRKQYPNGNVEKRNHTRKYSYEDRILSATKKEDVSSIKYDWFLEFYPNKKLTLKESN